MTRRAKTPPRIGIVSLGCPKALVDSERILTRLRAEGYDLSPTAEGADAVIVNTCGFLDSAKAESLEAIGEALAENGKVIVTGCLGGDEKAVREVHPGVLAVTGPHQYEAVVAAVHDILPPLGDRFVDLVPPEGIRLTPRHYAYVKISEGCNHRCTFCIIPDIRGDLVSRPAHKVLGEAERLLRAGVKELLVVSQDTGAYGIDLGYAESPWRGGTVTARTTEISAALGDLAAEHDAWVRLHYVYPYRHVDELIPLMAAGRILPYLDIPFQHASPSVLRAMKRPGDHGRVLDSLKRWRDLCPDLTVRSTFIVGFPGETEEDFECLLDFLDEADLDRVGCFVYEPVDGARANALPDPVDPDDARERQDRLMELQRQISEEKMAAKVGRTLDVLVDEVTEDGAIGRTQADAPEIDGSVYLDTSAVAPGQIVRATVTASDDYDLWASPVPR
jgi:ribosomal protein S12 methylthiotransferase